MSSTADLGIEEANREAKTRLVSGLLGEGAHLTFDSAVQDFPEPLYNEKPGNVPYTFWHQLEHIRLAQRDIIDYIRDPDYTAPAWPDGYWPGQGEQTDGSGWDETMGQYKSDREEFIQMIKEPGCNVLAPVERNRGRSILGSALIIIDHTAYHLGEFVMGRQILGAWKSELG